MNVHPIRRVTCRVIRRNGNQCTAEAVDPEADLLICTEHLARALRLIQTTMKGQAA